VSKDILMMRSLLEGQFYRLRSESYFIGDMIGFWRQLKRNKLCCPTLNAEFTTTDITIEYISSPKEDPEFNFVKRKITFGDHGAIIKNLLDKERFKNGISFEINQILSAFIECTTRSYMEKVLGSAEVDNYLNRLKKRLLNPRMSILEEMSDRFLSEVERNIHFLSLKQVKENIQAFDQNYLDTYLQAIRSEQDHRRALMLMIPIENINW